MIDKHHDTDIRYLDEKSRPENLFTHPNTTPREKGSYGPPKRPTSSNNTSSHVWEGIKIR